MRIIFLTITAFFVNACSTVPNGSETVKNEYLTFFINLHWEYCDKSYQDGDALEKVLQSDRKLTPLGKEYKDTYEIIIDNISYAVSKEDDGCSTDVLLIQQDKKSIIITLNEIDTYLISQGYKKKDQGKILFDKGPDGTKIKKNRVFKSKRRTINFGVSN